MIKCLPRIYPNELFSSYLARIYAHSGYIFHMGITREIFERPSEYVNYNFVNLLDKEFLRTLEKYISLEEIFCNHTLFPYYVRFLPKEKRCQAMTTALSNRKCLSHRQLPIPTNKSEYYLRYCPLCVKEDRQKYGECYFHVEHQIPELGCCPHHKIRLINTKKENSRSHDSTLWPLEELIESTRIKKVSDKEIEISRYVCESLSQKIDFYNDDQIGSYLVERLNDKYFSPRGEQKDLNKIMSDLKEFYRGFRGFNITKGRLATIYRNEYINVFDIYLIALFEGISTEDLSKFKQAKKTRYELFDDKVRELKRLGKTQAQIASILKVNHEVIRQILLGTYDKEKCSAARYRLKKWDWKKLDKFYSRKFSEIKKGFSNSIVTKRLVAERLGIKDKSLRNLTSLKKLIRDYKKNKQQRTK